MAIIKKKCWPEWFEKIKSGEKGYEFRLADFDIQNGDTLIFEEWDPQSKEYTGRKIEKKVSKVNHFHLDDFGQKKEIEEKGFYIIELEK